MRSIRTRTYVADNNPFASITSRLRACTRYMSSCIYSPVHNSDHSPDPSYISWITGLIPSYPNPFAPTYWYIGGNRKLIGVEIVLPGRYSGSNSTVYSIQSEST